jgi:hypothetical protein
VSLTVVRNGKELKLQAPVYQERHRLVGDLHGGYPSYFVYGPIVFSRATSEFLTALANNNAQALLSMGFLGNPMLTELGERADAKREELVVVASPFFPDKTVKGYSNRFGAVIASINNVPIRSLRHLVSVLRDLKDDMIVIRFDQHYGETIVLPRKETLAATESILSDNGIRYQGSADMMEVWEGKSR